MRNALLILIGGLLLIAGCNKAPAPAQTTASAPPNQATDVFRPIASVKQVMQGITIPASNVVFAVAGTAPTDDAGWQTVEASALAVAESGNLLLMKPRAVDDQEWRQYAIAMIEAGARAAEAAKAKDAEKAGIAGDDMYNTCEQCHAKYMPKP